MLDFFVHFVADVVSADDLGGLVFGEGNVACGVVGEGAVFGLAVAPSNAEELAALVVAVGGHGAVGTGAGGELACGVVLVEFSGVVGVGFGLKLAARVVD